jgi:putative CocE/NonD family hydrolase
MITLIGPCRCHCNPLTLGEAVTDTRRRLRIAAITSLLVAGLMGAASTTASGTADAATVPDPVHEAVEASAASDSNWRPDPERYGVHEEMNVPVRMSDGTVLRASIYSPTDPDTGRAASGRFPTLLTMTPYGTAFGVPAIGGNSYLVKHGYLDISVDVRGTGTSEGDWDLENPKQIRDAVELVHWASRLPASDGKVGLHGASYLGINQLLTAAAVGKDSPVKAIFPVVAGNDLYRDIAFMGGIPDLEFDSAYFGAVIPGVNTTDPLAAALRDPVHGPEAVQAELHRATQIPAYDTQFVANAYLGGPNSFDNKYWHRRSPGRVLDDVVANGIPAYLVGGHYDLFQRGEPMNYAGLQNAYAHRPINAPMDPDQKPTGRYQLLMGPYTHLGGATASVLDELQLRWFDQWLRGRDTGMDRAPNPLHVYDLGTGHYDSTTTYPYRKAHPTTYYLGGPADGDVPLLATLGGPAGVGTLDTARPDGGSDTLVWSPVAATTCSRPTDQWAAGGLSLITNRMPANVPCVDDDRIGQLGPTTHTYTSTPMVRPHTIAGPIAATLYATATTRDTQWVVLVEDVAPDGASRPLTEGALLGSLRARDEGRSWTVDGKTIMPYHPYTEASARPVQPGEVTRYDVEVFPTYATLRPGHRIRVTVSTADFPHLLPPAPALANLAGGVYRLQRGGAQASSITIPLN